MRELGIADIATVSGGLLNIQISVPLNGNDSGGVGGAGGAGGAAGGVAGGLGGSGSSNQPPAGGPVLTVAIHI